MITVDEIEADFKRLAMNEMRDKMLDRRRFFLLKYKIQGLRLKNRGR